MRKVLIPMMSAALTTPAAAHVGHLGELAGHDHWVAGAAIGAAAAVTIWGALKGKKAKDKEQTPETAPAPTPEEPA